MSRNPDGIAAAAALGVPSWNASSGRTTSGVASSGDVDVLGSVAGGWVHPLSIIRFAYHLAESLGVLRLSRSVKST